MTDLAGSLERGASLREQVTESLRAMIVTGALEPGRVYSAPALAGEFGVSATPVREAMLDLAGEGLVEPVRNKGFRVTEVSDATLDSLAELRALIEVPVMAEVSRDCSPETCRAVEALRPVAEELVTLAAEKDLKRYIILDTEFHLRFLALHGNPYVVDVVRDLRSRTRLFGLKALADAGSLSRNATEHLAIVDAALVHDTAAMTRVMTTHIGHVRHLWAGLGEAR